MGENYDIYLLIFFLFDDDVKKLKQFFAVLLTLPAVSRDFLYPPYWCSRRAGEIHSLHHLLFAQETLGECEIHKRDIFVWFFSAIRNFIKDERLVGRILWLFLAVFCWFKNEKCFCWKLFLCRRGKKFLICE